MPSIRLSVQRESFWVCSISLTSFKMAANTAWFGGSFPLWEIKIIAYVHNLPVWQSNWDKLTNHIVSF